MFNVGRLRKISDAIKQKVPSHALVLGSRSLDSAYLLASITTDIINRGVKADDIITQIAPIINGSGGGRPQLAQAGSKDSSKLSNAIQQASILIKDKLKA